MHNRTCSYHMHMFVSHAHVRIACTCSYRMYMFVSHAHVRITCTCSYHMHMFVSHAHVRITCTCSYHMHMFVSHAHVLITCTHMNTVRERVDRLELLISERNAEVPSDPLPPPSASESHHLTATPSRKIKIKNCESGQIYMCM